MVGEEWDLASVHANRTGHLTDRSAKRLRHATARELRKTKVVGS